MVRSFTENDIFDAIEVRGTVEGLGARPLTDLMVLEASRPES